MVRRISYATVAAVIAFAVGASTGSWAQGEGGKYQTFELLGGSAYNFDSDLEISQQGQPGLNFSANWDESGSGAPYYIMRYGNWSGDKGWEIEHIHHKIELTNNPPEVTNFQISHGFNMFMYNRAWRSGHVTQRVGAGVVVAHRENTVRGLAIESDSGGLFGGYEFAGGAAQYAASYSWPIDNDWFLTVEGKGTVAYADVSVVNGDANLWNYALHYAAGFGYMWR